MTEIEIRICKRQLRVKIVLSDHLKCYPNIVTLLILPQFIYPIYVMSQMHFGLSSI